MYDRYAFMVDTYVYIRPSSVSYPYIYVRMGIICHFVIHLSLLDIRCIIVLYCYNDALYNIQDTHPPAEVLS